MQKFKSRASAISSVNVKTFRNFSPSVFKYGRGCHGGWFARNAAKSGKISYLSTRSFSSRQIWLNECVTLFRRSFGEEGARWGEIVLTAL